jgi:hypothetical protein
MPMLALFLRGKSDGGRSSVLVADIRGVKANSLGVKANSLDEALSQFISP